jgi:hypothetical protein
VPPREPPPPPARPRRFEWQLRAIRVPAFVTVAVFAISLGSIKYAAMSREQDTPLAPPSAPVSMPQAPQQNAPSPTSNDSTSTDTTPANAAPVHFANPFDRSEVFDFPPGTSRDDARAAVAGMLFARARERLGSSR